MSVYDDIAKLEKQNAVPKRDLLRILKNLGAEASTEQSDKREVARGLARLQRSVNRLPIID